VLRFNLARKASRVRVFEIGRVFLRDAAVPESDTTVAGVAQPLRVCALAYGPALPLQWGCDDRLVDFYDVKGDLEQLFAPRAVTLQKAEHPALHPGRSAAVWVEGRCVG
ncbi:phenylalanine--tRNA ligase subunit beta, partial [Vibrio parahaemolyticus]|nr:phenylalanine--tRNA ligase subunit beta [Vibrio parahaemolyticus]